MNLTDQEGRAAGLSETKAGATAEIDREGN